MSSLGISSFTPPPKRTGFGTVRRKTCSLRPRACPLLLCLPIVSRGSSWQWQRLPCSLGIKMQREAGLLAGRRPERAAGSPSPEGFALGRLSFSFLCLDSVGFWRSLGFHVPNSGGYFGSFVRGRGLGLRMHGYDAQGL